jgi:DNA-binding transcriptional LysR family regulator
MPAFSRFNLYFLAAAKFGSIRKASEHLHISASAIDRQILMAERELGCELFERLPNGLRLTAAGEILLNAVNGWRKEMATMRSQLDDLRGLRRGHVQIATIDALTKGFLPDLIERLRREHPFIATRLLVMDSKNIPASVTSGAVDFGLMLNPQSSRDLSVRSHREIVLGFVSRTDHPIAARAKEAHLSEAAHYPIVAPCEPLALCVQLRALQAVTGITMNIVAESDNIQMIKSLARAGVGIGILCWLDVADEVARGELAFVPISRAGAHPVTLALCVDRSRQLSAAARLLLGWMEVAIADIRMPPASDA